MNGTGRVTPLDGKYYCTRAYAEEMAHSAYLLASKEAREREQAMARAFEDRLQAFKAELSQSASPLP